MAMPRQWWRGGVVYQVYPRSFADSDGDGVGDLAGITERLNYLEWLGIEAIWLNPTMPSPNSDWGYDVADYCDVHPELGSLADLDRLVQEARGRGIAVVLDLVPNHTSDQHAWFAESRAGRDSQRRDWYVWRDGAPDGSPPNNWRSIFGGPAWTLDERTGQHYLHNFLPAQPDLNWWSDEVRVAFDEILRFWLDRGIAGFRIDVAHGIVKDRELRDNPPARTEDPEEVHRLGQRPVYNFNRPEVHDVLRRWRSLANDHARPGVLIGETWAPDLAALARFYGEEADELHLAFNFFFTVSSFDAGELQRVVEDTETAFGQAAWPAWTLSNHDVVRFPTRWCGGDGRKTPCALMLLLTLRGTPFLYYGDELGLPQTPVPEASVRDPVGRDGARTPMQWSPEDGAGFTRSGVEPWLPFGDPAACNVEGQRREPGSALHLCRDLIGLRASSADLREGNYELLQAPSGAWVFRRGSGTVVALNLSDAGVRIEGLDGLIRVGTRREREGEAARDLDLAPWEGVVLSASSDRPILP